MTDKNADAGGVHYHYHFYGAAAPAQPGPGAQAPPQQPAGFATGMPPGAGLPGWAPPANAHPHPGADSLVKGLAVGAGVAWLLTSEAAQRSIMRTGLRLWTVLQGGIEELKERMHDAEAEVAAETEAAAEAAPEPEAPPKSKPRPVQG